MPDDCAERTVNGNGHAFGQGIAIASDKGGDFAKMIDLEVVLRDTVRWVGLDNVQIKLVGIRYRSNGG